MTKLFKLKTIILLSFIYMININCAYADISPSPVDVTFTSATGAAILAVLMMGISIILLKLLKFSLKKNKTCD